MSGARYPLAVRGAACLRYEEGAPVKEICADAGITLRLLYRWLHRLGVPLRGRCQLPGTNYPNRRKYGPPAPPKTRRGHAPTNQIPQYLVPDMVRRYADGESVKETARALGVARNTVLRYARRAGVPPRPRGGSNRRRTI